MTAATVTLLDGTEVDRDSEQWRHECEARAIASLPSRGQRVAWMADLEKRRGKPAADRLRATITKLWENKSKESK